ncbi:MAG: two-component system, OmpR family, response regulator RegX3 [Thermoleophilales bacterium]|nr:two-component system, OmpR family, response regulator RegX3 [Thermoleophilales bacterium]
MLREPPAAATAPRALTFLIVEDEPALREFLTESLRREGHLTIEAADGSAALAAAAAAVVIDVVLLDVILPGDLDGYAVCRLLRENDPAVPIIMLTALGSERDVVIGLEAGADDYVTKPLRFAELRSRIRAVLRRTGPGPGSGRGAAGIGDVTLSADERRVVVRGEPVRLTFSEYELLTWLMSEPGRAFSRQELLRAIWGDSAYRDPRAIDVHVRHLREKLEQHPARPALIITVPGVGYRFREP